MSDFITKREVARILIDEAQEALDGSRESIRACRATPQWRYITRWRLITKAERDTERAQVLADLARTMISRLEKTT